MVGYGVDNSMVVGVNFFAETVLAKLFGDKSLEAIISYLRRHCERKGGELEKGELREANLLFEGKCKV